MCNSVFQPTFQCLDITWSAASLVSYIASKIDWNISVAKLNLYVTRCFQMDVEGILGFLHYSYNVMLVMISKGEIHVQTP